MDNVSNHFSSYSRNVTFFELVTLTLSIQEPINAENGFAPCKKISNNQKTQHSTLANRCYQLKKLVCLSHYISYRLFLICRLSLLQYVLKRTSITTFMHMGNVQGFNHFCTTGRISYSSSFFAQHHALDVTTT